MKDLFTLLKSFTILLLLVVTTSSSLKATHLMGGDLTYIWMGGNTYKLRLSMYRDCAGIAINTSYPIDVFSTSCNFNTTVIANLEAGYPIEVSAVCTSQLSNTTCHAGGTIQGVEEYVYSVIYTLPNKCNDWRFSTYDCCRNNNISTGPAGNDFYLEAFLNNLDFPGNTSPDFITKPVPFLGVNQPQNFSHATIEPDGDVLVYSLVNPLRDAVTPVTFNSPYNANYPISTVSGTFPINTNNGQMSFTPNVIQNGVLAVLVQEYRNGVLIGSVRRDIQMVVINGTNGSVFFGPIINLTGATMNAGQTHVMTGCVGVPINFQITATDPNGSTPIINNNAGTSLQGGTLGVSGAATRTMNLNWTPPATSVGYNSFYITANDNNCPIPSIADVNIVIYVSGVDAFAPDPAVCLGQSTQLTTTIYGTGGGTYTWTGSGLSATNIANPTVTPATLPATYHVTYTQGLCNSSDDVVITSEGSINATPMHKDVCAGLSIPFAANATLPGTASSCGLTTSAGIGANSIATVGTGTTNRAYPFSGLWEDGRTQMLITAAELNAAGITGGILKALALNVTAKNSSLPYNGLNIKLGCTSLTALSGYSTGLSTVYSGNYSTVAGWNTFTFSTNYAWDGSSNLIVEICYDNSTWTNSDDVATSATAFSSVYYNNADASVGCSFSTGSSATNRPNLRFTKAAAAVPVYTWTPTTGLSSSSIANPVATVSGSTSYVVEASLNGCVVKDTIVINTDNLVDAIPSSATLCDNATAPVQLTSTTLLTPNTITPACGTNSYAASGSINAITVGSVGATTANYPFGNFYEDGRTQMLFLASELIAAGVTPGNLSSISLNVSDNYSYEPYNNFNVGIACTSLNALSTFQTGLTNVFSGTVSVTAPGWITFNFTTPYGWNGTSNLLVQMCFDNNVWSDDDYVFTTTTGFNSVLSIADDGNTGCTMGSPNTFNQRPVTRFDNYAIVQPLTYTWSPVTGLSSATIANPTALPSSSTTYTVTVSDGTCSKTATAHISVNSCGPLAAENLSLTATLHQQEVNYVQVDWKTDKEINVENYIVERKLAHETDYTAIGTKNAIGSANTAASYQFFDMDLSGVYRDEKIIYRIVERDAAGNEKYSNDVEVRLAASEEKLDASIYPNPTSGELNITIQNNNVDINEVQLQISDYTGKVMDRMPTHYMGRKMSIDVSNLTAGAYFLTIITADGAKKHIKFIKS